MYALGKIILTLVVGLIIIQLLGPAIPELTDAAHFFTAAFVGVGIYTIVNGANNLLFD